MELYSGTSDLVGRASGGRKLIAVVYMDVVGYSHLLGVDDVGTIAHLQALRQHAIDPAVEDHGGTNVQAAGDSILITFDSIEGAINCAIKVQQEVPLYDGITGSDRRMRFRIGVDIGDVIASGANLYGNGVNTAARLQSVCPEGGICVSRVVRDHMREIPGVSFEELGALHLKNIARPVEAFLLRVGMPARVGSVTADAASRGARAPARRSARFVVAAGIVAVLALCLSFVLGPRSNPHEKAERLVAKGVAIRCSYPCAREWLLQRALFEKAMRLDPNYAPAYAQAAYTYTNFVAANLSLDRVEDLRVAGHLATQAVALAPDKEFGYEARGAVLRQDPDRIDEALSAYLRALTLAPDRAVVRANVGWMLILLGRPADAEPYLSTAIARAPNYAYAPAWLNQLGLSQLFLGHYGQAVDLFQQSLSKQSRSPIAADIEVEHQLNLASALALDGHLNVARELIGKLRSQNPALTTQNLLSNCICSRSPGFVAGVDLLRRGAVLAGLPEAG